MIMSNKFMFLRNENPIFFTNLCLDDFSEDVGILKG